MRAPRKLLERVWGSLRIGRALRLVWASSPRWTSLGLGLVLVQALLPLLALYLTKLVVDAVAAGARDPSAGGFGEVLVLIGLAALVGLAAAVADTLSGLATEAQGQVVTDHVLNVLHDRSVQVDLEYYENPAYHDTLHRAQREAPYRPPRVLSGLLSVVRSAATTVGIVILLATVHWILAALLFVAVGPGLLVRLRHSNRRYRWQREQASSERRAQYLGWLLVHPGHAKEVRALGLGSELSGRFRQLRDRLRRERLALVKHRTMGEIAAQVVAALAVFASYGLIGYQTFQGALTIGDLVMYFGAVQRGQALMRTLLEAVGGLYEDNLFLAMLDEFLAVEPRVVRPVDPKPVPRPFRSGFAFEDVSFHYPGTDRPLLQGIDMELRPGQVVALVGENGAGKTTLVKLLCRLYDPTSGRITLDGTDLRDFDPVELRRRIGVLFQDYGQYYLSARDNIWFGAVHETPRRERLEEAARRAGADRLIERLPHGYETILGRWFEGGEELSIGEWQRVALARAFASDSQMLVVDEPTSALDAAAEAEVFEAIRRLVEDRAALVISHRFSTVRTADRIDVLEAGRIIESGDHDELMRKGGRYAELFRIQAAPYADPDSWNLTGVPHPPGTQVADSG